MATQPVIPGNKVLEELGKLHVQLRVAEENQEQLIRANQNLSNQLKDALAKSTRTEELEKLNASQSTMICELHDKLVQYEDAQKSPAPESEQ